MFQKSVQFSLKNFDVHGAASNILYVFKYQASQCLLRFEFMFLQICFCKSNAV